MRLCLLLILWAVSLLAQGKCDAYGQGVRRAHFGVFGLDYPYQYGVAQLHKESNCRNIISNDGVGSQGVPQITYRWWQDVLNKNGIFEITSTPNQLRAQAVIMKSVHRPEYGLWVTYQIYNGGSWVLKEIARAGVEDWEKAKTQCRRGNSHFTLRNGTVQTRSNCEINYEYSQNIYTLGRQYGDVKDNAQFRYW